MILDNKKTVTDYAGELMGVGCTMKNLALEAFLGSKIDDPNQSEIAGNAMEKIHNEKELDDKEKAMTKIVMMAFYHPKYLAYISKQFDNGNTDTKG